MRLASSGDFENFHQLNAGQLDRDERIFENGSSSKISRTRKSPSLIVLRRSPPLFMMAKAIRFPSLALGWRSTHL